MAEEKDISIDEKNKIWDLIYQKISESVEKKQNFAILLSSSSEDGFSAIITEDQYLILLESYLQWSKEQEKFETCIKVNKTISELKSWIKKN
jgi:hypothetical protein